MKRQGRGAFTLVELLVVIAVIAILAGLAYPVYQRSVAGAKAGACLSNLRQLGTGLNAYLSDNNMMMPTLQLARDNISQEVPVIDNTLDKYVTDKRLFACPADNKNYAATTGTSYCWNVALNGQAVANLRFLISTAASLIPILGDKEGFHPYLQDKVNILYADGHVTKDLKFTSGN
jgi:prepilin-type N-terminal cleavage/methylation domain-containing protein/prepilin-type processing-associated H-X9-DG protein